MEATKQSEPFEQEAQAYLLQTVASNSAQEGLLASREQAHHLLSPFFSNRTFS
jgi:hypothetical protein